MDTKRMQFVEKKSKTVKQRILIHNTNIKFIFGRYFLRTIGGKGTKYIGVFETLK